MEVRSERDVVEYLVAAYEVDEETATRAVAERHSEVVADAIKFGSFAYYPAGKIAGAEGWKAKPEHDVEDDE